MEKKIKYKGQVYKRVDSSMLKNDLKKAYDAVNQVMLGVEDGQPNEHEIVKLLEQAKKLISQASRLVN